MWLNVCVREDMSAIYTWSFLLLWVSLTTQDKTPDVHVTCTFLEECLLPCSFQPAGDAVIHWFRQDVVVHSFLQEDSEEEDEEPEQEQSENEQYAGRTTLNPRLVSHGIATLILRGCGPKDRGRYRCHVRTSAGVHQAHVIVKVEAPIQSLTLELSRLSGYEEMKCATRDVYPDPHVTWATDPPTPEALRPITRKQADKRGLYTVESRLRRLWNLPELTYICMVNSSYGTQAWTASLREREISGIEGRDMVIPCHAPPYLRNPSLSWSFASGNEPVHILTYNSLSRRSSASAPWEDHVRLDTFKIPSGDGSLRLVDPDHLEHEGVYTCVYSTPQNTHTEHISVTISAVGERRQPEQPFPWWIVALVIGGLILALLAILVYLKVKGIRSDSKPRSDPEETTELQAVKDTRAEDNRSESSPMTVEDTNGHTTHQSGSSIT